MSNPSGVAANHTAHYTVTGMTCGHCVTSVTEEVQEIAVTDVQVDLDSGVVTITNDQPVSEADVRAAVEAAGYQLA